MARSKTELAFQDDKALMGPGQAALLDQIAKQSKNLRVNAIYGQLRKDGAYDFSKLDQLVNAARQRGIHTQMTLMGTPRYAPQLDQALSYEHNDPRLWQQYANAVAAHFKGRVGRYSVGNEMNHGAFLKYADVDPISAGKQYRGIYRAGMAGIKSADKSAQVLLGELTSNKAALPFLKSVLAGKALKTGGLAYHPYVGGGGWDINSLPQLQKFLASAKKSGKLQTAAGKQAPLYLTEMGYMKGYSPDAVRIKSMEKAYALARAAGARQLLQYQLMPTPLTPGQPEVAGLAPSYGQAGRAGFAGSAPSRPAGWWDTSIADVSGRIPVLNKNLAFRGKINQTLRGSRKTKRTRV